MAKARKIKPAPAWGPAVAGDPTGARPHWEQALARYTEMGVPHDADRIRAKLAVTDNPARPGQRQVPPDQTATPAR